MDCPPSSPPRLLPGFAPNKNAKFEIFQDIAHALPSPLPTSERDVASSPSSEANDAVMPARTVLKQLRTLKLRPDIPVLVGRSSRACEFALETKSKLVSRIHARCCYESATDLITVECLGWNGLTMVVPTSKGPKDYPVVRDQTIYIEKVNGVELSIQNTRTFIEVITGPSETTEDEVESTTVSEPVETNKPTSTTQLEPQHKNIIDKTLNLLKSKVNALASPAFESTCGPTQSIEPILQLKSAASLESEAIPEPANALGITDEPKEKENLLANKRVHFEVPESKIGLSQPKVTTLAEYRKRRLSMGQGSKITESEQANTTENTPLEPPAQVVPESTQECETAVPVQVSLETDVGAEPEIAMSVETEHAQPEAVSSEIKQVTTITNEEVTTINNSEASKVVPQEQEPTEENASTCEPNEKVGDFAAQTTVESASEPVSEPVSEPAPEPVTVPFLVVPASKTSEAVIESVASHDTKSTNKKRKATEIKVPASKKARKQAKPAPTQQLTSTNHQTIEHLATNCVAFSRLNSTPLSHILASSHEFEGVGNELVAKILEEVACIGVIQREGKDALGKPLEPEYYYIGELDTDTQRKQMVLQSKGGKSLRACRRVHKQYFYKRPK